MYRPSFREVDLEELHFLPQYLQSLIGIALLIGMRVTPVVVLLPFGKVQFHWQLKILICALLTTTLTVFHGDNPKLLSAVATSILPAFDIVVSELLAGLAIGTSILVAIEGVQLGAQWVGLTSGVSLRGNNNQSALATLIWLTVLAGLITAGVHRLAIAALLECYDWLPIGSFHPDTPSSDWFASMSVTLMWSFALGLKLAAPAIITMLAANITMGWISRQAPQFHQFVIGLPANTAVLLAVVMLTLGTITLAMQQEITAALNLISK